MRKMYCSRDSVSGCWQDIQCFSNDQEAIRSFCFALACASIPESFVKDIDLYFVGSFDETSGEVFPCEPFHVVNGRCDVYDFYRNVKNSTYNAEDLSNEISKEKA